MQVLLTGERNYSVDVDRVNGFAVSGDERQLVALESYLGRTDGSEGIDETETVTTARGYRKHLQGSVGHESSIGILQNNTLTIKKKLCHIVHI